MDYRIITLVMPSRKSKSGQRWSMYAGLHDDVSRHLEEDALHFDFHNDDDAESCIKEYDTNVMGQFICPNRTCASNGWSSKRIAITIRMYSGARYNARVYHQRCKACNSLSKPDLDDSYAERVAYRLKKWRGIKVERPVHPAHKGKPHQTDLCEGCNAGHCTQLDKYV